MRYGSPIRRIQWEARVNWDDEFRARQHVEYVRWRLNAVHAVLYQKLRLGSQHEDRAALKL